MSLSAWPLVLGAILTAIGGLTSLFALLENTFNHEDDDREQELEFGLTGSTITLICVVPIFVTGIVLIVAYEDSYSSSSCGLILLLLLSPCALCLVSTTTHYLCPQLYNRLWSILCASSFSISSSSPSSFSSNGDVSLMTLRGHDEHAKIETSEEDGRSEVVEESNRL